MTILKASNISKQYRLGNVGTGTLSHDLNRFWHRIRGKEDPYLKVGAVNDRSSKTKEEYVWALRDINFEVQQGEVLGIIGKNGAGKSTLLKILSRVTSPTTGVIKTKGRIASLLEVGTGFHPELTGRENIYLNGAILGMTKTEINAKLDEIIGFSGCDLYIDTPVKRYSSGMKVRLAFAVAAHLEPDILVVDEVLAVGDAEFQKKAIGKMQDISKGQGRTVLFVSHNMGSVKSLCTRAIVLENGLTAFEGKVDVAVDYYLASNTSEKYKSLQDRNDRAGGGFFRFTDILIRSQTKSNLQKILSGEDYVFRVFFSIKSKLEKVSIRLRFIDKDRKIRFLCNNCFVDDYYSLEKNEGYLIDVSVPNFPLPNGIYTIQLSAFSENGIEDDIEDAFEFSVVGGDFYKTGREQRSKEGVLVDYEYTLQNP
ncbi:ABC transporter ATP-binding protein [Aequorivita marina]|uniref:ABC transporter ATP-binding protein n=1 Tax=Aequorivita marina TaxID=3073654 RepID=UPI003F49A59E